MYCISLQTGLLAIRVFGCTNLYLDKEIIPDHFGLYVDITIGFSSKCTSVQSCFKKGRVIWDESKNFSIPVSECYISIIYLVLLISFLVNNIEISIYLDLDRAKDSYTRYNFSPGGVLPLSKW